MKRPEVLVENFKEVYEYYEQYRPGPRASKLGHLAMSLAFRPRISFADKAENEIASLIADGTRIIISANHINNRDQYVVGAAAQIEPTLRPLRGKTFIPAKESLFQSPLLRRCVDTMGAIPAFRAKDAMRERDQVAPAEHPQVRKLATKQLLETAIKRIDRGDHMAIFPEGTRNTANPLEIQELKEGVGVIAVGVSPETNVAIIPMGICYGPEYDFRSHIPTVHIGQPLTERYKHPSELTADLHIELQNCVDIAAYHKMGI